MVGCVVCGREASVHWLCAQCVQALPCPPELLPASIVSPSKPTGLWLIDVWGRAHVVPARGIVGRTGADIAIMHPGVSRKHALVERRGDAIQVTDLASHNGTFVDDARVEGPTLGSPAKIVRFGPVAFWVASGQLPVMAGESTTRHELAVAEAPQRIPAPAGDSLPLLLEPTRGGGGVVVHQGRSVTLTIIQYALVDLLARRAREERRLAEQIRGYVPTNELLVSLPWDSPHPEEVHLKQLVRRTRKRIVETGVQIASRRGFGYRLETGAPANPELPEDDP